MKTHSGIRWLWVAALLAGLAMRVTFALTAAPVTGDGPMYQELARNWRDHRIYGLDLGGNITPVDIRMPGYPAFLAAVSLIFGRGEWPPTLAQAVVDIVTCLLAAALAALLVPSEWKKRVGLAALCLASLCPFVAIYTGVTLTEVVATFWTAAALVALAGACAGRETLEVRAGKWHFRFNAWFVGGIAVGLGTLVRPETPLLLIALALLLIWRWRQPADWPQLLRAGALSALGLALPLIPWCARNAITLHEFQPLAPRYAQLPGEFVPHGFNAWTNTWLVRYRDVLLTSWKPGDEKLNLSELPDYAFDSDDERARVQDLYDQYDENCCDLSPEWDAKFAGLARERTARHPLRTYLSIPVKRVFTLWFRARIELTDYSARFWPPLAAYRADPADWLVTLFFGALGILYVVLAKLGVLRVMARRVSIPSPQCWAIGFLCVFCLVRTAYFTQVETPEPRYMLECFPAVFALGALAWIPVRRSPAPSVTSSAGN